MGERVAGGGRLERDGDAPRVIPLADRDEIRRHAIAVRHRHTYLLFVRPRRKTARQPAFCRELDQIRPRKDRW